MIKKFLRKIGMVAACVLLAVSTANARCIKETFTFDPALTLIEAKAFIVKLRGVKNWQKRSEDLTCETLEGGAFRAVFRYAPNSANPNPNADINLLYDLTQVKTVEISVL
jgi:hypothetical protein